MAEVIHPAEVLTEIQLPMLLSSVLRLKKENFRLSQACAAYVNEKLELSYSFANDDTYEYETLRLVIERDEEVPSITEIIPPAVFYENEMKELFGVKINMISNDLSNRLYRIEEETPMVPKKEEK